MNSIQMELNQVQEQYKECQTYRLMGGYVAAVFSDIRGSSGKLKKNATMLVAHMDINLKQDKSNMSGSITSHLATAANYFQLS